MNAEPKIVEAHGATDVEYTKALGHELGAVGNRQGDTDRTTEKSAVAERHVKSGIAGLDATKSRFLPIEKSRRKSSLARGSR
jgi:hypothetical protein